MSERNQVIYFSTDCEPGNPGVISLTSTSSPYTSIPATTNRSKEMKKYYLIGGIVTFVVIFNLGYVFHEILMGQFFRDTLGPIQREEYIIPVIALAFFIYTFIQAYFLHIFYTFARVEYRWGLTKTALIFGTLIGFLWDGLQGGMIEVATFKMPAVVFYVDSSYHTLEGTLTAWILSMFYRKFVTMK